MSDKLTAVLIYKDGKNMPSIRDMDNITKGRCEALYVGDLFADTQKQKIEIESLQKQLSHKKARLEEAEKLLSEAHFIITVFYEDHALRPELINEIQDFLSNQNKE